MPDAFVCYASEDNESVVRPLVLALQNAGLDVWYDKFSLSVGDSLLQKIEEGLRSSRYGIVVFSPRFFAKKWPQAELDGLFARDTGERDKVILPVWHDVDAQWMREHAPIFAGRWAARAAEGLDHVVSELLKVVRPELACLVRGGIVVTVTPETARLHSGLWAVKTPIRIGNATDIDIFSVWVCVRPNRVNVASESIVLERGAVATALRGTVGPIEWAADVLRFNAFDEQHRELVLLLLHSLPARTSLEFILSGTLSLATDASLSALSFAKEPAPILEREGQAALRFVPPLGFYLKGTGVLLRRRP